MRLTDFVRLYASQRDVVESYVDQLTWCVRALDVAVGPVDVGHLSTELVARALQRWRQRGLSDETRRSRRRMLMTLWKDASRRGLVPWPLWPPAPVTVADRPAKGWTHRQVQQLLAAAEAMPGVVSPSRLPLARSLYWSSYVAAAWDTGLRGCDMRRLRLADIGEDGTVQLVQKKTGRRHIVRLQPATVRRVDRCAEAMPRPLVWPAWGRIELWRRQAAHLVKLAGIAGSIGHLRHSSGTDVELRHPGLGHKHLGNTAVVFDREYFNPALGPYNRPSPTPLESDGDVHAPATIPIRKRG